MKKFLISILMVLALCIPATTSAEFFSDIIVTSPDGIWTDERAYSSLEDAISAVAYSGQLTINTANISAPDQPIFNPTGSGEADFARGTELRSAWFDNLNEMFDQTVDNYVTVIINSGWTAGVTADATVGDNVTLKWEGPGQRIVVNSGFTLSNVKNISAGSHRIFGGSGDIDFKTGSVLRTSWFDSFRSAVSYVDDEDVDLTLVIDGVCTVDTNTTIDQYINLQFENGTLLSPAAGVTVTIYSPNNIIAQSSQHIFAGDGSINFSTAMGTAWVDWWGPPRTSGSDDALAIQSALNSGARKVGMLAGNYYVSTPVEISVSDSSLFGQGMYITVINANSDFAQGSADAKSAIWLNNGADYINIERLRFVLGAGVGSEYVDHAIYALGDSGHQELDINHISVAYAASWALQVSCYLSEFSHIRVANSPGIWVGKHNASSTEGTNITFRNCYVVQNSQSSTKNAYKVSIVAGYSLTACAADYCNIFLTVDNASTGKIDGCDGEYNRQILSQTGIISGCVISGSRFFSTGDSGGSPSDAIFNYYGNLSLTGTYVHLASGGAGSAYTYFFKETSSTRSLQVSGLTVELSGVGIVDPINDTTNCPNLMAAEAIHIHPEHDPFGKITLSAAQSINTGTETKILWDSSVENFQDNENLTEGEFCILSNVRGVYEISALVTLDDVGAGKTGVLKIYREESGADTLLGQVTVTNSVAADMTLYLKILYKMGVSRSYYVTVEHDHGSARNVLSSSAYGYFQIRRIMPYVGR